MSKGKEMFMKYKTRIGELYQKMRNGEITEEEKKELYDLRERLFGTIKRYGLFYEITDHSFRGWGY